MKNCCVPFCNSRPGGYEKISFHEFPSKLELRAAWVKAISREGEKHGSLWTPSDRSYICHKHFAASDYSVSTISRRILLPNSIPSIFPNYPAHILSKSSKKRKLSIPEKEIPSVNKRCVKEQNSKMSHNSQHGYRSI